MTALKRPAMRPSNGAVFYGSVHLTHDGKFEASCHSRLDLGYRILSESREFGTLDTEDEAENWIALQAGLRGFEVWTLER